MISPMTDLGCLAVGLANDFYSFPKEFDEHAGNDSLDMMHNAIAVLMSNYGYTEDESREILKTEILSAEQGLLDAYEVWKTSPGYKSSDLRRYAFLMILAIGGGCYFQARSPRYHGRKLRTTAEDRAQLVGRNNKSWILPGYSPPKSSKRAEPVFVREPGLPKEKTKESAPDILAPFEKASAEQVRGHPCLIVSRLLTAEVMHGTLPLYEITSREKNCRQAY
jgi:geranylgeranyl diphosphate synthase, type III